MAEAICAISTPYGLGAISIVRASGDDVIKIVNSIFRGANLESVPSFTIHYGHIMDGEETVDEVLVSVFKAPKTYTKEDIVEINTHGGIFVANKILKLLVKSGCRLAEAGEFTKRAFLNGRIDLMQAESVMDIISSQNDLMLKESNRGLRKELSDLIINLREQLLDLIAKIEVNIDYPEYDDAIEMTNEIILPNLVDILGQIDEILKTSYIGKVIAYGIDTAIIGRPNVGKSSILNMLLNEDKAIVSQIAGTTRDTVEGRLQLGDITLNLVDTAGIHQTEDQIEKEGIEKAKKTLEKAELVLLVIDNNDITDEDLELIKLTENKKRIILVNKVDLDSADKIEVPHLNVSAKLGIGLKEICDEIRRLSQIDVLSQKDANFLTNTRQISTLEQAKDALLDAKESCLGLLPVDMIEIDIKKAWDLLGNVIGIDNTDELIDNLFSKFCLGK